MQYKLFFSCIDVKKIQFHLTSVNNRSLLMVKYAEGVPLATLSERSEPVLHCCEKLFFRPLIDRRVYTLPCASLSASIQ